jgi:hypothetical protein
MVFVPMSKGYLVEGFSSQGTQYFALAVGLSSVYQKAVEVKTKHRHSRLSNGCPPKLVKLYLLETTMTVQLHDD